MQSYFHWFLLLLFVKFVLRCIHSRRLHCVLRLHVRPMKTDDRVGWGRGSNTLSTKDRSYESYIASLPWTLKPPLVFVVVANSVSAMLKLTTDSERERRERQTETSWLAGKQTLRQSQRARETDRQWQRQTDRRRRRKMQVDARTFFRLSVAIDWTRSCSSSVYICTSQFYAAVVGLITEVIVGKINGLWKNGLLYYINILYVLGWMDRQVYRLANKSNFIRLLLFHQTIPLV